MNPMLRRFSMSIAFVRRHLSAYVGAAILLGVATVIATAEMVLFTGLVTGDAVEWGRFTAFDEQIVRTSIYASRGILQVMCFTTVIVALVLVLLGFRNMLALRRRELGQMRLAGASVLRIRALIAFEAAVFASAIVIPSVLVGQLLAHPFYVLMQTLGVFGKSLHLDLGFPVLTLLAVAAGMIFCSVIAAWFSVSARRTTNILEALDGGATGAAAHRMSAARLVVAVLSVLGLAAFLIFMPNTGQENPVASVIVPLLIVFPLGALAPLLVPVVAQALAWALRPVIRGSGVLVAQRANRDSRRFASNVLPLLILVGVMGGFSIGSGPDQATMRANYDAQVTADLVATPDNIQQATDIAESAEELSGVEAAMRSTSTTRLIEIGRPEDSFLTVFNFVDLDEYEQVLAAEVASGSVTDAGNQRVVSAREGDEIGDLIEVEAPNGTVLQLEVAAVIASTIYTDLLLDWELLEQLEPETWDTRVFLSTDTAQTDHIAAALSPISPVIKTEQFVDSHVKTRADAANSGNIALFGTVYALAIVAMVQGAAASTLNRQGEYRTLSLLGISRPKILITLLSESLVLVATSAVLLMAAFAFIAWRYLSTAGDAVAIAIAAIPWGGIALTFAGMSTLFVLTVLVSALVATRKLKS